MSNVAFSTVSTNRLSAQPITPGKIYVRSTNGGDSTTLEIFGDISASPGSETISIAGTLEKKTTSSFDSISQSILDSALTGIVSGYALGTAAVGDVRGDTNPADGTTITLGTETYRFKNTLAAVNDVKIQSTLSATMASLCHAINSTGTSGTDYYGGTSLCFTYSGVLATNVITLTDRIPCLRTTAPAFAQSSTHFSLRPPIGGVDGILLFQFPAGVTSCADPLTFSTEDHSTATLPALMLGTSPAIPVQGQLAMLRLWSNQTIDYKIESSTDQINWRDTSEGTVTLTASTETNHILAELHEFIRFVIVTNSNTTDSICDFRVIW